VAPYKDGKVCFTQRPDGTVFAVYLADEDEAVPPAKVALGSLRPADGTPVKMLGVEATVRWEENGKGALLTVPDRALKSPPCRYAWTFSFQPARPRS
jgi:alpha-L-fucosidase